MSVVDFPFEVVGTLSIPGLLGLAVWMILTGRLIPRRTYDEMVKDRDHWRAVAETSTKQNTQLLEGARVTTEVVRQLPSTREIEGDPR